MLLSIITINYKKSNLTIASMGSLYKQFEQEFKNDKFELIILDNSSGDDSVEILQKEIKKQNYKNIKIIANNENFGFGKGCNIGAAAARGNLILFLNNDTIIKDRGIEDMVDYIEKHAEVAILGGQLRNSDGSLQPSAGKFYTLLNAFFLLLGMQKYGVLDKNLKSISQVDWVKGGLFMIRSEVFKELGGFDENIFMYIEDMELCYRAKLVGHKIYFYPFVTIIHAEQGSSNRSYAIINIYKSLLYFYKKHRSYNEYLSLKTLLRAKAILLIGVGRVMNNSYLINTYEKALKVA